MANPVTIRGLQPVSNAYGAPFSAATRQYVHDSGNAVAIYMGDLVTATGASSTVNGKTLANVVQGATGDVFQGVVVSVEPDTRDSLTYCAASTTRMVNVCDDPNVLYEIQEVNSGTRAHRQRHRPQLNFVGCRRLDRHRLFRAWCSTTRPRRRPTRSICRSLISRTALTTRFGAAARNWLRPHQSQSVVQPGRWRLARRRGALRWRPSAPAMCQSSSGPASTPSGDANYTDQPTEYTDLFDVKSSEMAYEEDVEEPGFGLARSRPRVRRSPTPRPRSRPSAATRTSRLRLGFIVTHEEMMDNLYMKRGVSRTEALARSMRITKETVAANVYNRAQTSGYTGGDGVVLSSTVARRR
jgi:hypothetical protein